MHRLKEEINFDEFNSQQKKRINDILNKFLQFYKENINKFNQEDDLVNGIYNYLIGCDLKDQDCSYTDSEFGFKKGKPVPYFADWYSNFIFAPNIRAFSDNNNDHWFQFVNGRKFKDEFIKLYVPLDSEHIKNGVIELFQFLADNNIVHQSKVGDFMRTDDVIVRINDDDYQTAHKIIDFLKNNDNFQNGKNLCNPFLPTVGDVGIMVETGISYNFEIAKMIASFIKKHVNDNDIDLTQFCDEIDGLSELTEVKNIFNCAIGKYDRVVDEKQNPQEDDDSIFFEALNATYKKYDFLQAETALAEAINNNDYKYFTGYDYRKKLKTKFDSTKLHTYILNEILKNNPEYQTKGNVEEDIEEFMFWTYDIEKLESTLKLFPHNNDNFADKVTALIKTPEGNNALLKTVIGDRLSKNIDRIMRSSLTLREIEFTEENYVSKYLKYLNEEYTNKEKSRRGR